MRPITPIVLVLAAACAGTDTADAPFDAFPVAQATEVLRLGGPDAPEEFAFTRAPALVATASGNLFVRIANEGTILVLDPAGRVLRRIGGRGGGPGEFETAAGHGFVGDTLWVRNWPAPQISRFLLDGTHLATDRTPYDYGYPSAAPPGITGLLVGGRVYVYPTEYLLSENGTIDAAVILADATLARPDTVAHVQNPAGMYIPDVGIFRLEPVPAPPLVAFAPDGTGFAIAEWTDSVPGTVYVRRVDASGADVWRRTLRFPLVPIPQTVRDSLIAHGVGMVAPQIERNRSGGMVISQSAEDLVRDALALPEHYAPIRALLIGGDGTVWLQRAVSPDSGPWVSLSADGEPRFEVETPPYFQLGTVVNEAMWGTMLDEMDVPYIVKLELDRS